MEENTSSLNKPKSNFWDTTTGTIAKIAALITAITGLIVAVSSIFKDGEKPPPPPPPASPIVFLDGKLGSGLNMGVNTSEGQTNWVSMNGVDLCMSYPNMQKWGAVFITVGTPTNPPRPSKNYSSFNRLILELKGQNGGETILIGLKDNQDPDDGSESKVRLTLTNIWAEYSINVNDFQTAEMKNLYVVTEFVFENRSQTICARKIQFMK
jgi:hypothetical protein